MSTITMPNPTAQHVATWLRMVTSEYLRSEGWNESEHRFRGIVDAARTYAKEHFAEHLEQQEAFFDGLALALAALGHFADIEHVRVMLDTPIATDRNTTPPAEAA